MIAAIIYCACALTSGGCAWLLARGYRASGTRLLFWAALCFVGLTIDNIVLFIDLAVAGPSVDLFYSARDPCGRRTDRDDLRTDLGVAMKFYMWGILAMASLVPALFFLRYWRSSRDRLFAFFAIAFGLMAIQWTLSALSGTDEADHFYVLLLRILAFVSIIVGVLDKNHRERRPAGG